MSEDRVLLRWRGAARGAAAGVGVWVVAIWPWVRGGAGWPGGSALAVLALATAVVALSPAQKVRRGWDLAGWGAAALALGMGLAGAPQMAPATRVCLVILPASLLLKRRLHWAVLGDLVVAFVGYAAVLDCLMHAPGSVATDPIPVHWEEAVALLVLSCAWMAAWPQRRPVSFYLESGSAASVIRRLLPITLLYPLALVFYGTERAHGREWTAHLVQQLIIFGTIGFVAALLWVIARELDRRDEMADQSSYGLRESEQRYRQQFENNPQPMWVFSVASLRFLAVNDSAVREFGYTRAEFLARTVLDMHPQEDYERVCSVVGSGQPCKGWLWRYRTRSGEWMEAEVFAQPIVWHGEPAFLSFLNDVTARRRAEGRVREQEEQVRLLLESTSEGIFALDLDGRFVWCNPAAAAHLGLRCSGELSGKLMHPLAHHTRADGKLYPEEECSLLGALHAGQPVSLDEELMWRVDGTSFPADVRASPLYREGKLVGAVVTLADATERRNLRAQFQEAQKMEVVGRLAAGVAHDFNNLLTVINGYMELLLEQGGARLSGGRRRRALESVRQAGERAAWLTKQLLAFSRRQVVEPKLLDLGRVLEEMMPLLRQVLREDIDLVCVCEPGLGTVRADSGQIGQILMNLVVNARDAMPKGGRISLEAANARLDGGRGMNGGDCAPGEYVQLAVRDAGTGMDAETRSHVFEPFFTTKPVGKGTGLGLASVLGIAKQSGGTVDIESGLGRGTTVRVYLPRVEARQAARTPSRAAAACGGGETILVVEDEDGVRELTCEALRSRGYEALDASGPGRALQLLDGYTGRLDMVITDVVMPEMDGLELARRLAERRRGLPVLFVSGYADLETAKRRELERAAGFIQKPFTPEMLAAKVRAVLDEQQEAAARSV